MLPRSLKLLWFSISRRPQRQKKASELDAEVLGAGAVAGAVGGATAVAAATAGPAPAAKKVEKPELSRRERERERENAGQYGSSMAYCLD